MLLDEIAQYLTGKNIGVNYTPYLSTGNLFFMEYPKTHDEVIVLRTNAGQPPSTTDKYSRPAIQVLLRSKPHNRDIFEVGEKIITALAGFSGKPFIVGGYHIINVQALQSTPQHIRQDDSNRHEFSFNFLVEYHKGGI
jgi:hypothetical protein